MEGGGGRGAEEAWATPPSCCCRSLSVSPAKPDTVLGSGGPDMGWARRAAAEESAGSLASRARAPRRGPPEAREFHVCPCGAPMCFLLDVCAQHRRGQPRPGDTLQMCSWHCPWATRLSEGLAPKEPLRQGVHGLGSVPDAARQKSLLEVARTGKFWYKCFMHTFLKLISSYSRTAVCKGPGGHRRLSLALLTAPVTAWPVRPKPEGGAFSQACGVQLFLPMR